MPEPYHSRLGLAWKDTVVDTLPYVEELRLTAFKSFSGQRLPLEELTLLVGRNGSGKSNALDALMVLARLAEGEPLRDTLDGARTGEEPIRGGAEGCAPFGQDRFGIGCRVRDGEAVLDLDVTVMLRPEVRIASERLVCVAGLPYGNRRLTDRPLLATDPSGPRDVELTGRYFNGRRGPDPGVPFAPDRLLTSQVPTRVPLTSEAAKLVQSASATVRRALRGTFLLDPVPHLMRQYVHARDFELRRGADNLSAAVAALQENDAAGFRRLEELIGGMPEYPVSSITSVETKLGDVQLALQEEMPGTGAQLVPARQVSDGMLRFLAFGTALLTAPVTGTGGRRLLVVEEVENGLYPTQAARVLELMREESHDRDIGILFTTHSPALLNALVPADHEGVVVCDREPATGASRLQRLVDLPGYAELMAAGNLGDAVARGRLPDAMRERSRVSDWLLGFPS